MPYLINIKKTMNDLTKIFNQVSQLKVRSVTDPLFKYGLLCLVIGMISGIFSDKDWVTITALCFAGLFLILGIVFYSYFAIKKPDYLRSETYQLKKQAFEMLGDNELANNKNLVNIPSLMNPYYKQSNLDEENPLLK